MIVGITLIGLRPPLGFFISDNVNVYLDIIYWRDKFNLILCMQRVTLLIILEIPVNITTNIFEKVPLKTCTLKIQWFYSLPLVWIACPKSLFTNNPKKNNSEVYGAVLSFRFVYLKKVYCLKLLLYHSTCLWIFESLKLLFKLHEMK